MYRSSEENGVRPLHYDCCSTINISDHRPVFGIFEATINPVKEGFVRNNTEFISHSGILLKRLYEDGQRCLSDGDGFNCRGKA